MRNIFKLSIMAVAAAGFVGCQPQPAKTTAALTSRSALDVHPVKRPAPTYSPQNATPPEEPTVATAVMPALSETPDAQTPVAAIHGRAAAHGKHKDGYQVKKGDTLYRIAKAHYGDAKKWTQIASANPGISPQSLKAGQTITLP